MKHFTEKDLFLPSRACVTNKGDAGRVLVIGGNVGMCGAAAFAALGAYRTGCGLVDVYTHPDNRIILQTLVPEAVLSFWQEDLAALDMLVRRADAVLIGVGFGTGEREKKILERTMELVRAPLVIDADGLNILASSRNLISRLPENTVLTPHLLELSRLTGLEIEKVKADVFSAAEQLPVTTVAKSAVVSIVFCDKKKVVVSSGNSSLSTGGTGDILAGMIASLLAQKMPVETAVPTAVFLHGRAGTLAGERLGERSVIARDVIDSIPHALKEY